MPFTSYLLRYDPIFRQSRYSSTDVWSQKPAVLMAVKTANDLGIFSLLSQMTSFATCGELAARNKADIQLVGRSYPYPQPLDCTR
jgi:hypothetical protein